MTSTGDPLSRARAASSPALPVLAVLGAALAAVLVALIFTGAVGPRALGDPGPVTRWGLPLARTVFDVAFALTLAGTVFLMGLLPHGRAQAVTEAVTSGAAVLWTLASAAVAVLTYSSASGVGLSSDPQYTLGLGQFLSEIDLGRAWLAECVVAGAVTTLVFAFRSRLAWALTTLLMLISIVPLALTGHAAGGDDHMGAVNAMGLHLLGAGLWVGGVLLLSILAASGALRETPAGSGGVSSSRAKHGEGTPTQNLLHRYSALASFALVLVASSGVVSAALRMTSPSQLLTPWGMLVAAKALLTLLAGYFGWLHRTVTIARISERPRLFGRLILGEGLLLGTVSGLAAALAATPPPRPQELPPEASPARILTGYPLPPELTPSRYLTQWRPDWLWIAIVLGLAVVYARWFLRLRRRGDRWPVLRLLSWGVGLVLLTYFTSGAPAVYGRVLFSTHMLGHMSLTMLVPIFLVIGAPVTLALRALPTRQDGTRGPREWLLSFVHGWWSTLVTHPLFAAANFAGSIIIFYYSDLFLYAMKYHVGHELMNVHFLLTGYIFALTMIGTDPLPKRFPYPMRLVLLFATMAFHAFFGVTLMGSDTLLQAFWFGNMGRDWGLDAISDQKLGGGITWGIGELPTLCLALGVMLMWSRADKRETRRKDRAAERDHDAELRAYNEMLAARASRERNR